MRPCFTLLIVVAVSLHASAVSTTNSNGSVMTPNSELTRNQLVATDVSGLLSSESDPNVVFTNGELLVHGERVKIGPDETEVQEIASAAVAPVASSVTNLSSSVSDLQSSKADRSEIPGNYLSVSNKAMTAVQVESDPTVPAWAKQATPPQTMTTNAVDALANSAVVTNALTVATTNRVALLESSKADQFALEAHVASTSNPHSVTAEQVNAYTKETVDAKLDEKADIVGGKIPASQLPSYVDDVLEYDTMSAFPVTGEVGKIYVAKDTNLTYRWSGTQYVEISPSPLLDDTVTEKSPNGVKSSGIWSWVKSLFPKWLTSDYAEPATVASVKLKADKATTLSGYGITDAVPFVEDASGEKTAVTIGIRKSGGSVGQYSLANGLDVIASGDFSHAEGYNTTASAEYSHAEGDNTAASSYCSHAEGVYSHSRDTYAFAWNGDDTRIDPYESNGPGTFNINPKDGLNGFYIGEQTLYAILTNKADKSALNSHVENKSNPHAVTAEQVGALPLVEDKYGVKTAVMIGSRNPSVDVGSNSLANGDGVVVSGNYSHAEGSATTAAGNYSHAEGSVTTAAGDYSHAEGVETTAAGNCSHAEGFYAYTKEQDSYAFAWNGDWERREMFDPYESHGEGTFNINPVGGLNGFWIGEQTLGGILALKADKSAISATNPTFSNAVLAVGLNIDTNSVAVLNEIAETFGGFPLGAGETATTVGGLLAALAAAIAWLKKNKVGSFADVGGASATVENGVAKLDNFFTESNSLLTGTIDARLPYPLYAVPSTGLLKDRAINTTSLASVTVPDNFTDLLVRASVASSLAVTMPAAIATKYGDTFPGEAGEYLITITKTGATEAYVRTIKLEEVA